MKKRRTRRAKRTSVRLRQLKSRLGYQLKSLMNSKSSAEVKSIREDVNTTEKELIREVMKLRMGHR